MIRRESKFQTKFSRWVKYRWPEDVNAHFELKVARTNSLPFSAVSDKQKNNLRIAQKRFFKKYSDMDRMGTDFDCSHVGPAQCFIVIQYYRPQNKEFFMCPIDVFLDIERTSDRKSITEEQCRDLCRREQLA